MANPTLLKTPIASGGDKNTIPETTGSTTGLLSQEKGWQQINSLPINAGGIAPSRLDFNGVFNLLSNILFYTQKGWVWEFEETQSYFAGCTVKDTVDGKTYVCIADVNASTTHPSSDTTHWKLSDLATKDDLANYLPLAGGTMDNSAFIKQGDDSHYIQLLGGTSGQNGGQLILNGATSPNASTEGNFLLRARWSTATLAGYEDGRLKWGNANVLTDANGGYLPLSGGSMTGNEIRRNVDNSGIDVMAATDTLKGAWLSLRGKDASYGGTFGLYSSNGSERVGLEGDISGRTLTWNHNDLAAASIVAKSLGTNGYIKYASGLTIQWGYVAPLEASVSNVAVSFPISFSNACFGVYSQSEGTSSNDYTTFIWIQINSVTTSGFKFTRMGTNVETGRYWFAIGC